MAVEYTPSLTDLSHPQTGDDASLSYAEIMLIKQYINNIVIPAISPAYSSSVAYVAGNVVNYASHYYKAISATQGNVPTNTTYWTLIY